MKTQRAKPASGSVRRDVSRRSLRAFTLPEICAVIAIMGVAAAIAAPRFGGSLDRKRAESAAQRVIFELAAAQQHARQTGESVLIEFDTDTHCVLIPAMKDPQRPSQPYAISLSAEPHHARITAANVKGAKLLTFNGYGDPDGGGTVTIAVGSEERTIEINEHSGRAYIP